MAMAGKLTRLTLQEKLEALRFPGRGTFRPLSCTSAKDDEVRNTMEMLANIKLSLAEDKSLRTSVDAKVTASDAEQCFDVENDDDVSDAVVAYIVDEMEKVTSETPAQEAEQNEVECNEVTASPPSLVQLYAMFRPIQESAFLCNLPNASSHLQRALQLFTEAIHKSNATAQQQMLITEMLPKRL